jgi:energy-coupling factor transport system substrate-specific component
VASFVYGYVLALAFWPFVFGTGSQAGFDPAAGALANLHTFVVVNTVTSLGWNLGRAVTTVVLVAALGPGLLHVLRRAPRTAVFAP